MSVPAARVSGMVTKATVPPVLSSAYPIASPKSLSCTKVLDVPPKSLWSIRSEYGGGGTVGGGGGLAPSDKPTPIRPTAATPKSNNNFFIKFFPQEDAPPGRE